MGSHPIALIKWSAHDPGMELLIALVLVAITGVLAQGAGTDSRDADTRHVEAAW